MERNKEVLHDRIWKLEQDMEELKEKSLFNNGLRVFFNVLYLLVLITVGFVMIFSSSDIAHNIGTYGVWLVTACRFISEIVLVARDLWSYVWKKLKRY